MLYILALFLFASLPFSLSLSYVPLTLALLFGLRFKVLPRDFLLILLLYAWRFVSLLMGGRSPIPIKDVYDKSGYVAFSSLRLSEGRFNLLMAVLGFSFSTVSVLGILGKHTQLLDTGREYAYCLGRCEMEIKDSTSFWVFWVGDRRGNFLLRDGERVPFEVGVVHPPGRYTLMSERGIVLGFRSEDVSLGKGWRDRVKEPHLYGYRFFKGFYDHPLHVGGVFGALFLLFLTLGLFYSKAYLLFTPLMLYPLHLADAKFYLFISLLLGLFILYLRLGMSDRLPALSLWVVTFLLVLFNSLPFLYAFRLRLNFWKAAIEVFGRGDFWGIGYDHAWEVLKPFYERGLVDNYSHFHNSYLTALVETGVVGFLLLLFLNVYFPIRFALASRKVRGYARAFNLAVAFVLVFIALGGIFESNYDTAIINLLVFSLMGVGYSLSRRD